MDNVLFIKLFISSSPNARYDSKCKGYSAIFLIRDDPVGVRYSVIVVPNKNSENVSIC